MGGWGFWGLEAPGSWADTGGRGRAGEGTLAGKSWWVRRGLSEGQGGPEPVEWGGGSCDLAGHVGLPGQSCPAGGTDPCKSGGTVTPRGARRFMRLDQGGKGGPDLGGQHGGCPRMGPSAGPPGASFCSHGPIPLGPQEVWLLRGHPGHVILSLAFSNVSRSGDQCLALASPQSRALWVRTGLSVAGAQGQLSH